MRSRTYIATPPGETIKEQLMSRNMTQKEFAARMDMSEKHISQLINGTVSLTPEMAMHLEMVLGVPSEFWNKLESIYRDKLVKVQAENDMDADLEIIKKIPYNEMSKLGWIEKTGNRKQRVFALRKFFEVVRLNLIDKPPITNIACRQLGEGNNSDYALLAWAQKAKLEARSIETSSINIERLIRSIPLLRDMTVQDPADFSPALCDILKKCGIALVLLPHIGGSFLHGATFQDRTKIVIGLTLRGRDADKFWFSLFHEIGHIVLGHLSLGKGLTEEEERAADSFARNALIEDCQFQSFISNGDFNNKSAILMFSEEVGISPGIVVGRLQKEGYLPFSFYNDLKIKYIFR
ncbi:HigA family addiction module antitoxin [Peptococcus simiae]|uniref:HigA family addiction module antitoxin n=1 Tax=Peptococcus simiae TaxID=1643805 RepID=UPI003980DF1A